jgi:IstB-like ATP binding protein
VVARQFRRDIHTKSATSGGERRRDVASTPIFRTVWGACGQWREQAGVGKTFLASALGHSACRAHKKVLFIRADTMLKQLNQSRADNSA